MSIKIYPVHAQVKGGFNHGEILENKPIQLSEDESKLQPYSSIFYWAHAWATTESTIGLHPHKGFEIMSFVLKGEIQHYDTKNKNWIPLKAGDVQIIRAGSGISHAEKMLKEAHIFQIWFDPDLSKTIRMAATYDDYAAEQFALIHKNGLVIKKLKDESGPIAMQTPGVIIQQINALAGEHTLELNREQIHSIYLIAGALNIDDQLVSQNDFIVLTGEDKFFFHADTETILFMISSPSRVPYRTYAQRSN